MKEISKLVKAGKKMKLKTSTDSLQSYRQSKQRGVIAKNTASRRKSILSKITK
ncbi:MAG: hypothetical protein R3B65_00560 [Candidatus Paceibacterota bacterium]